VKAKANWKGAHPIQNVSEWRKQAHSADEKIQVGKLRHKDKGTEKIRRHKELSNKLGEILILVAFKSEVRQSSN